MERLDNGTGRKAINGFRADGHQPTIQDNDEEIQGETQPQGPETRQLAIDPGKDQKDKL